jgi:hypothetical protein
MALTADEKARLVEIYEPILYFHPDEIFPPSDPGYFMRASAMWCSQPTDPKVKENWGDGSHLADTPFPRTPLIPKGRLSLDPADDEFTEVDFIGKQVEGFRPFLTSNQERELFLQTPPKDWVGASSFGIVDSGPDTDASLSAETTSDVPAYSIGPTYSYYVDVRDQDTAPAIPVDDQTALPPGWPTAMQGVYPKGYWLLTFYFFYTYHAEALTDCEVASEIFRAKRSGDPLPRAIFSTRNPADMDEGPTGAFAHGSYAGDWHAVSVLVANPGTPMGSTSGGIPVPISPLELFDNEFPDPDVVGFSRRARGVDTHIGSNLVESSGFTFMPIAVIERGEAALENRHVKVFVAKGTHNNYATDGSHKAPKFDAALPFPIDFFDACEAADDALTLRYVLPDNVKVGLEEAKDKARVIGVAIAKILGGLLLLGPIGLIPGIGSAMSEGMGDPYADRHQEPFPHGAETAPDEGPRQEDDNGIGVVVAPQSLRDQLSEELENKAKEVKAFSNRYLDRLIDRDSMRQLWWRADGTHPLGYQGRWGVLCERDPFDRRSGTTIPLFEASFISAVLRERG